MTSAVAWLERRIGAIAAFVATLAVVDPTLEALGATCLAGRDPSELSPYWSTSITLVAIVTSLVVALAVARAGTARTRARAIGWCVLGAAGAGPAVIAAWALVPQAVVRDPAALFSAIVMVAAVPFLSIVVALASLPAAMTSFGPSRSTRRALVGAAATLGLAAVFDLVVCVQPLRTGGNNPAFAAVPTVIGLASLALVAAAAALVVAAHAAPTLAPRRLVAMHALALGVVGLAPLLYLVTLAGAWTPLASGTTEELHGVARAPDGSVWIVGAGATVLHLESGAARATRVEVGAPPKATLRAVCATKDGVWIVGDEGLVVHGEPDGARWSIEATQARGPELDAVWCDDEAASVAVGGSGTVLRRTATRAWEPALQDAKWGTFTSVTGRERVRFALGFEGAILRSEDAGETWTRATTTMSGGRSLTIRDDGALWGPDARVTLHGDGSAAAGPSAVAFEWRAVLNGRSSPSGFDAFAHVGGVTFAAGRGILRTRDEGRTLEEEPAFTNAELHGLAVDGAGRVIAVGSGGVVLALDPP